MANQLYINDLIEWVEESGESTVERIVWIDENYILAFTFDINKNQGVPYPKKISEIEEAIDEGYALKLKSDPWLIIVTEEHLSEKEIEIRDRTWNIISNLVQQEPEIYDRKLRGSLVNDAIARSQGKVAKKTIYGYLRKYWQRGKTKNSLLPDYSNSGGKGKTRKYSNNIKRGRPRKYKKIAEIGKGVNITEEDRRIFRIAISKFYNNRKGNFLTTAYKLMLKEYYTEEIIFDDKGVKKSTLIPPDKQPTIRQFRYWYDKEHRDIKKTVSSRRGSRAFALEHRAILGNSQQETIGPGSRYQIDATIADVYLVSKYNRNWIIGRPVVYVVIDVFSRMITGVYVGLEGPSWLGMMMALVNAATDKVKFCAEYGIEITEEEWLAHHIPDAILGDRGELAGKNVETSINNLGIRIENAAPYRADWKGLVERHFRIIHDKVKPFLPGYVDVDFTQRGGKDYRLDSKLDLDEFTKIIIHLILQHNNHHYLPNYDREEMMITDDVQPIPRELWQWGIANRSGRLKTFPEDIVKLNLMPTDRATITAKGIKFKKLYYTSEKARKEQWFERARSRSLSKDEKYINISYDPRKPDIIYFRSSDGRDFEKCFLIDYENKYMGKNLCDIEYLFEYEKQQQQVNKGQQIQKEVDLMSEIEAIVTEAEIKTNAVQDKTLSNNQRVKGIRDNRGFEKEKRREEEAFELSQDETLEGVEEVKSQTASSKTKSKKTKSLKRKNLELLKKMRLERSIKEE
ncbi:MAG: DDE-type integrase/transposase/recombinase [Xenococcaceae cyanobacterium MO_167.B27]|nr:DDE-type integrase/transposase/recombinase [Xenococcaceae cyanobacterium MO_167.B27]